MHDATPLPPPKHTPPQFAPTLLHPALALLQPPSQRRRQKQDEHKKRIPGLTQLLLSARKHTNAVWSRYLGNSSPINPPTVERIEPHVYGVVGVPGELYPPVNCGARDAEVTQALAAQRQQLVAARRRLHKRVVGQKRLDLGLVAAQAEKVVALHRGKARGTSFGG
eukprot:365756-Chlamydomonas_euryale.AAC.18